MDEGGDGGDGEGDGNRIPVPQVVERHILKTTKAVGVVLPPQGTGNKLNGDRQTIDASPRPNSL